MVVIVNCGRWPVLSVKGAMESEGYEIEEIGHVVQLLDRFVVLACGSLGELVDELLQRVLNDSKTLRLVAANKVEIFDEAGN